MECLDEVIAFGLVSGSLDPATSAAAREHIDTCDGCRDLVAAAALSSERPPPPQSIGRYQITEVLGSGAMGIVYEAIDPQLDRHVAIKVLRGDTHPDRLLREARAAAKISHPNVIAVFDAGIADGEVFMAMELIRGQTLRQWLAAGTRPMHDVVEVLVKAGRGLAAIHRAELVHRDFKPDNVLVANDGRIIVTDLGLVRGEAHVAPPAVLDVTQTGAFVGTPAYAAPEQLEGLNESDARSDQFSYCVTLYEALAGRRPFVAGNLAELRAAIDRGPPRLEREVPARIALAVQRGLAVDPARRWPAMTDLVDGLEHAIAPRRVGLIAAGVGLAALASGALWFGLHGSRGDDRRCDAGSSELARVWNPAVKERLSAAFAHTKVAYAPSTWAATIPVLDRYGATWAAAFDDACAATHVRHVQSPAVLDLRAQCLERRRVELVALLDVLATPEATQVNLAASAASSLVSPEVCGDAELLAATDPVPDAPEARTSVLAARAELARSEALYASGKYKEAIELARTVSARAVKIGYAPLVAEVDKTRGRIAIDLEAWDEAKEALDSALLAAERGRHHRIRADVQIARAYLAISRSDPQAALTELANAEAVVAGLGDAPANRARVEDYRGAALASLGTLDEAQTATDHAVKLYETAEGPTTLSLANPLTQLAFIANQRGDLASAVAFLERALAIQARVFGPDHPRIGYAHTNLAFNLSAAGRLDEATTHAEAARALLGRAVGVESMPYAEASRALVGILTTRGELAKAEKIAREVVATLNKIDGKVRSANAIEDLANVVRGQQHLDDALALHQQALAIYEKLKPPGHPSTIASLVNVGDVLADLGRCREALVRYATAAKHSDGPEVPPYLAIAVRMGRGRCLVDLGQRAAAVPILREALARNADPQVDDDRKLRAQTRFLLAQAVEARREAHDLATAAKAEAVAVHDTALASAIDAWLVR